LVASAIPGAADAAETREFAFPLLGDLHFDRLEHHDMAWLQKEKPNDIRQVENYSRITREVLPGLFREVKEQIAAQKVAVPFAVHIGDFVEGLAGTPELALRHCREAVEFVETARIGAPFLFCKGNHDVTGPGSVDACNAVLMPFLAAQAKQPLDGSVLTVRQGDSLFVYFDAYDDPAGKGLDRLEKQLAARGNVKQVFFIIHPPVVPYGARSTWHIFAKQSEAAARTRLLNLLGGHRAIVFCGHLHKYGTVVRQTDKGSFVQMAVISVLSTPEAKPKDMVWGVKEYGPDLVRLEPNFSPATIDERREYLKAETPFIRHYDYADAPGYSIVRVNKDSAVSVDMYTGLGKKLWKTVKLTELLRRA
ncbi:MAG: metallophosphoesterase, partial [Fibrella sp.]|nr:metallophosphoesterase [Armatimonadota bacterium]